VADTLATNDMSEALDLLGDDRQPQGLRRSLIEVLDHGGIVLVNLSGELTSTEATDLRSAVDLVLEKSARNLQLGLAEVVFMDSGGAQALIRVREKASASGVAMQLLGPSPQVHRVLDVTGLAGVFDIIE
jgi:anti-sigma B factor antagonist